MTSSKRFLMEYEPQTVYTTVFYEVGPLDTPSKGNKRSYKM